MHQDKKYGYWNIMEMVRRSDPALTSIHENVVRLREPKNYFHGLKVGESFTPDNILFFCHRNRKAFEPEGVSNTFHHRFVFVMVVKQGGPARIGDHTHHLQEGEGVLIFPHQFHHFMDVKDEELEWLFVTFELKDRDPIRELRDKPRKLDRDILCLIAEALQQHQGLAAGYSHSVAGISYYLAQILLKMKELPLITEERRSVHTSDDTRDQILEKINLFVSQNLHRQLTIADLAEELGYSVSYLRTIFRNRLGFSLGKFIRTSRLSKAAALLEEQDISITEVAEKSGFDSLTAFSRAFKNAYGISPKAYSKVVGNRIDYVNGLSEAAYELEKHSGE